MAKKGGYVPLTYVCCCNASVIMAILNLMLCNFVPLGSAYSGRAKILMWKKSLFKIPGWLVMMIMIYLFIYFSLISKLKKIHMSVLLKVRCLDYLKYLDYILHACCEGWSLYTDINERITLHMLNMPRSVLW